MVVKEKESTFNFSSALLSLMSSLLEVAWWWVVTGGDDGLGAWPLSSDFRRMKRYTSIVTMRRLQIKRVMAAWKSEEVKHFFS